MTGTHWRGSGPEFELIWCGSHWSLRLDAPNPGLEASGAARSRLLSLLGIAVRGRFGGWEVERPILTKYELHCNRVEGSYTFSSWGGLALRASWGLARVSQAVDLEVQVLADSVDYLKALEVQIFTDLHEISTSSPRHYVVEARDREAAGLSYDGRESDHILQRLTTLPVPDQIGIGFEPKVMETPWLGVGFRYIECVHPEDVARRVVASDPLNLPNPGRGSILRTGLFGHDLEKGVLLRSRMRGIMSPNEFSRTQLDSIYREFRESPLPLGP